MVTLRQLGIFAKVRSPRIGLLHSLNRVYISLMRAFWSGFLDVVGMRDIVSDDPNMSRWTTPFFFVRTKLDHPS